MEHIAFTTMQDGAQAGGVDAVFRRMAYGPAVLQERQQPVRIWAA